MNTSRTVSFANSNSAPLANSLINANQVDQSDAKIEPAISQTLTPSRQQPKVDVSTTGRFSLLRSVLEGLMDGILILNEQGKLIDANHHALTLCHQLLHNASSSMEVPQQIWLICQELIKSRRHFPESSTAIEDEISLDRTTVIRIRARWIESNETNRPYLLVVLEDRRQTLNSMAIAEAHRYGLTERETQIWLLRRTNQTYKAIAAELHIAIDTVKKHVKSIHAKREAFLWANE